MRSSLLSGSGAGAGRTMLARSLIALEHRALEGLRGLGEVSRLAWLACRRTVGRPRALRDVGAQLVHIGNDSLPIVVLGSLAVGMVLALQAAVALKRFGAEMYVGTLVSLSVLRELGPMITGLLVGGRVGAGMTAEVGGMQVTEQIDAIRALGADPIEKIVVPKLVATIVAVPLLTVVADLLGVLGGMIISSLQFSVPSSIYLESVQRIVTFRDFLSGVGKTFFFGFLIAVIACHKGMTAKGGTVGVGLATTSTVVEVSIAVIIADFFLTKLFLGV